MIGKVTPKTPEITSKTPEITPKTPEITPKIPEMTLKMLPKTKSFREENGDFKEFDLHKIEKADINFNEGQKETDYLVHGQSVLKMRMRARPKEYKNEEQNFFVLPLVSNQSALHEQRKI